MVRLKSCRYRTFHSIGVKSIVFVLEQKNDDSLVHRIINDGDAESLIHKSLKSGVMSDEKYEQAEKEMPQGGNLSPLLSNIMLNELDKELEARGCTL